MSGEFPMFCFECLLLVDYGGGLLTVEFACKDSCVFSCSACAIIDDSDMNLAVAAEDDSCRDITQLMAETDDGASPMLPVREAGSGRGRQGKYFAGGNKQHNRCTK